MYNRLIHLDLEPGVSAFLWGPRKVGKSTFLKAHYPQSAYFNLLNRSLALRLQQDAHVFVEWVRALSDEQKKRPIIVDEVQKVSGLLDSIHFLIEEDKLSFILSGSSARKLKRGQENLLGGRAWRYEMGPLCWPEIPDFDLLKAMNHGLIPQHYLSKNYQKYLTSYVADYLAEEIQGEAVVRNVPAFAKFLQAFALTHGGLTHFSAMAADCGVSAKTIQSYYQILVDTLLAHEVLPFTSNKSRHQIQKSSKYYLFDVGVAGVLQRRKLIEFKSPGAGEAFEHLVFMQLKAFQQYGNNDFDITFWRTKEGFEVDFILGNGEVAIEVKCKPEIRAHDLKNIKIFANEFQPRKSIVVCLEPLARRVDDIDILPGKIFFEKLFAGEIF